MAKWSRLLQVWAEGVHLFPSGDFQGREPKPSKEPRDAAPERAALKLHTLNMLYMRSTRAQKSREER